MLAILDAVTAGVAVAEHWPRDGDAAPQFDAIMSLAVCTCIEGRANHLTIVPPQQAGLGNTVMRLTASTSTNMSGLIRLCLEPNLRPRTRAWADERALFALLTDEHRTAATAPRYRDVRGDAARQLDSYCARVDQRGGLRPCAHAVCGATEAHVGQFKLCAACKKVAYCGRDCQQTAWKQHKAECRATQQAAGAAASA